MNIKALKQLVRVLQTVASQPKLAKAFHMSCWFDAELGAQNVNSIHASYEHYLRTDTPLALPAECGTTACAVGYAGLDTWFRKQGLTTLVDGTIEFDGMGYFPAVAKFFDIKWDDAEYLFKEEKYHEPDIDMFEMFRNPVQVDVVLARVIDFIRRDEPDFESEE